MGTFTAWRHAADRGELRRVTWVCGEQRVLVEEVVDTVRLLVSPGPLDYAALTAGEVTEQEIWAAASLFPVGGRRLVLIRDAHRLRNFGPLMTWLTHLRELRDVYLMFVSADADLPHTGTGRAAQPTDYIEAIRPPRGHLVRCSALNPADAVMWLQRKATLDDDTATHLLARTGGDLTAAGAVAAKLALFDGQPSARAIDTLVARAPHEFTDALIFDRKPDALHAITAVPAKDYPRITGQLDSRLDLLAALWRATRAGLRSREIHGLPQFLVHRYLPAAKLYDPDRLHRARTALAVVDDAVRRGITTGALEALTALW